MKLKTKYKHIYFEKVVTKKKTQTWECRHRADDPADDFDDYEGNVILGVVKWHAPWRQYCYFQEEGTFYSGGCLEDIRGFIKQLMDERKTNDRKRR